MSEIKSIAPEPKAPTTYELCRRVKEMVDANMVWTEDAVVFGVVERWVSHAKWILDNNHKPKSKIRDDCLHGDERVLTVVDGIVIPVPIRDIKAGDTVVSYDFVEGKTTQAKVLVSMSKGLRPVNQIRFKNGLSIRATEDHPFWIKRTVGRDRVVNFYKGTSLSKPDDGNVHVQTPFLRKVPYTVQSTFDPDIAFLIGHYMADGWKTVKSNGKFRCFTSGYEIETEILPLLRKHDIDHGALQYNGSGVPMIEITSPWFKDMLYPLKTNSFDVALPSSYLSSSPEVLHRLLEGYYLGDGHDHKGYNVYSTSSPVFASQIYEIHKKLGLHCHQYVQENHGGVGTKPIFRIQHKRDFKVSAVGVHSDLMNVAITEVSPCGEAEVFDLSIDQTHSFVLENGMVAHNCDGFALTSAELLMHYGVKSEQVRIVFCDIKGLGGHLICCVDDPTENDTWVLDNNQTRVVSWKSIRDYDYISALRFSDKDTVGWREIPKG